MRGNAGQAIIWCMCLFGLLLNARAENPANHLLIQAVVSLSLFLPTANHGFGRSFGEEDTCLSFDITANTTRTVQPGLLHMAKLFPVTEFIIRKTFAGPRWFGRTICFHDICSLR